jgi:hypothetical protein
MSSTPTLTPPPARTSDRTTAFDICNRYLFTFSLGVVLVECVGCFLKNGILTTGVLVQPHRYDFPLLVGLFLLFCTNFNFYKRFIEPRGESAGARLFSLFGMWSMAALPILMVCTPLYRCRYLIFSAYLVTIALKSEQLRRSSSGDLKKYFRIWSKRATSYSCIAFLAGLFFFAEATTWWSYRIAFVYNCVMVALIITRVIQDEDRKDAIANDSQFGGMIGP